MADPIDSGTLQELIGAGSGVTVLDVREEDEVREDYIDPGSGVMVQLHIDVWRERPGEAVQAVLDVDGPEPIVVVCWEGDCSREVAALLEEQGLNVMYLDGGIAGWDGETGEENGAEGTAGMREG